MQLESAEIMLRIEVVLVIVLQIELRVVVFQDRIFHVVVVRVVCGTYRDCRWNRVLALEAVWRPHLLNDVKLQHRVTAGSQKSFPVWMQTLCDRRACHGIPSNFLPASSLLKNSFNTQTWDHRLDRRLELGNIRRWRS